MSKKPTYEELEQRIRELEQDVAKNKMIKETFQKSEEKYRYLYQNTPVMVHSIDSQGRLLSVSNRWLDVMGYKEDEVIGLKSTEFLTEASRKYAIEVILPDFFQKGYCTEIPYQFIKKNGETIDVLLSAISEKDDSGKIIRSMAVLVDVTERKRAEEAQRESEAKYRSLVESTSDWIWEIDKEGIYTYSSPKVVDLLGYKPEEITGKTPFDLMPSEEAKRVSNIFFKFLSGRKPFDSVVNTNLHKNGHIVVMETSGVPIFNADGEFLGYRGIDRDITERKRITEALKEGEAKYRKLSEELEKRVNLRTTELETANQELQRHMKDIETFNRFALGREKNIISLKKEVNELLVQSGKDKKYLGG